MNKIINKLANLLSVKSLIALVLTGVFAAMSVSGVVSSDFQTIYVMIITFYFASDHGTTSGTTQDSSGSGGAGV